MFSMLRIFITKEQFCAFKRRILSVFLRSYFKSQKQGLASAMKSSRAQRHSANNIGPPPSQDGPGKTLTSLPSEADEPAAPASNSTKGRCQKPLAFLKGLLEGRQAAIASSHSQAGDKAIYGTKGCDAVSPCPDEESVYFTSSETSFRLRSAIKKKRRKKKSQLRRFCHQDKSGEENFSVNEETDFARHEPLASFSTFMRQTFARLESGRNHQPDVCNRKGGRIVVRKEQERSRPQSPVKTTADPSFNYGWTSILVNDEPLPQLIEQQLEPSDSDSTLTGASQSKVSLPGYNYTKMHLPEIPGFFGRKEPMQEADENQRALKREYDIVHYDYKIMRELYSDDDELYDDRKRSARRRSPTEIGVDQANMRAVHLSLSDCSGQLRSTELLSQQVTA